MNKVNDLYRYNEQNVVVSPAAGATGTIICTFGGGCLFRVYHNQEDFTDYEIRHDELPVTIEEGALPAFYECSGRNILDHSHRFLD